MLIESTYRMLAHVCTPLPICCFMQIKALVVENTFMSVEDMVGQVSTIITTA